jgi:mannose-6-phosphate isomerase-like protein (cupin superfamily)
MVNDRSRRNFLRTAPIAAAVTLSLTDKFALATPAGGGTEAPPEQFQLFTAQSIQDAIKTLHTAPGNKNLFDSKTLPVAIVLTIEEKKSAKEFEWHEGRDHVLQVLEGSTRYEVGGTPKGGHSTKPGEWLAPASEGATTMTLHKGDMLVIPRGTPHKRSTEGSVTFTLISTTGNAPA